MRLERTKRLAGENVFEFQFHKGAIRTVMDKLIIKRVLYFNSIKVRLELYNHYVSDSLQFDFNSIKVRLEPVKSWA